MKSVNTLFPTIDINASILPNLLELCMNSTPVRMYTYDTCVASYNEEFYIESRDSAITYDAIEMIVSDLYGSNRMDNKITLEFNMWNVDNKTYDIPVYVTYKDNRITMSTRVNFWNDVTGPNSYRVVNFDGIRF